MINFTRFTQSLIWEKKHKIGTYRKAILFILFNLVATLGDTAHAEFESCSVGDETQGYWVQIVNTLGMCPFPGPPAVGGHWTITNTSNISPFRIEGRYKIIGYMSADGWDISPPPSRPICIEGYAEAYTSWACTGSSTTGSWTTTYTASSTLCTRTHTGPNGYHRANYVRYFDGAIALYEWKCNAEPLPDNKANWGPSCSPGQCCK